MTRVAGNQSLVRGMEILKLAANTTGGISLKELAVALGSHSSTVHHLVKSLLAGGYLEKTGVPVRYRLGAEFFNIARLNLHRRVLQQAGRVMLELQEQLGPASIGFCEHLGGDIVHTLHLNRRRPGVLDHSRLEPLPAYTTGEALVFQAYWSEQPLTAFRRRYPFFDYGAHAWDTLAKLEAFLEGVRRLGYAMPEFRQEPTWIRIAAPVFTASGRLVASLGIFMVDTSSDGRSTDRAPLIRAVVDAANSINEEQQSGDL